MGKEERFELSRRHLIRSYFEEYAKIARAHGVGLVLESATWRANPDWARLLGYSDEELDRLNRMAIELLESVREDFEGPVPSIVISGCIGPRGDGYVAGDMMSPGEAQAYHAGQIRVFREAGADINCAHPSHFEDILEEDADWVSRIRGLRANSSRKSHAELDEAEELDEGNPSELGAEYRALGRWLPALCVLGGCSGTDHRHVAEIASAWLAPPE